MAIAAPSCMPSQRISFRRTGEGTGYTVLVFLFFRPRVRGSQGTNEADWGHWGQTRFGYARSKRSQPQFKAHNSVRPFENGLSLGGTSATRPRALRPLLACRYELKIIILLHEQEEGVRTHHEPIGRLNETAPLNMARASRSVSTTRPSASSWR